MISTNKNLPFHASSPMDPLHDECSGMANLEQSLRRDKVRADQLALLLGLGMVIGGLIVWCMVIFFTK